MPQGVRWSRPRSGHVVWLRLPARLDPDAVFQAALSRGIAYTRGDAFHLDGGGAGAGDPSFALSFAGLAPPAIREGIARLAEVVGSELRRGRRRAAARPRRLADPASSPGGQGEAAAIER